MVKPLVRQHRYPIYPPYSTLPGSDLERSFSRSDDNAMFRHRFLAFITFLLFVIVIRIVYNTIQLMRESLYTEGHDLSKTPDMLMVSKWGEKGSGVKVNINDLVDAHREEYKMGYYRHGYNQFVSDRISTWRQLPDLRHPGCRGSHVVTSRTPRTSVIIVFRDEARSVLLRTLFSVINRTPADLLEEILLLDIGSKSHDLQKPALEHYLSPFTKVKVHRLGSGHTVTSAHSVAAKLAEAEVLVMLTSRCEVTSGWLQPLLAQVQGHKDVHRAIVAVPALDEINYDTFQHMVHPLRAITIYNWDWTLSIHRVTVMPKDPLSPLVTPTLGHMIYAVNKTTWLAMAPRVLEEGVTNGGLWELSLRCWLCGCQILTVPCSRVGLLSVAPTFTSRHIDERWWLTTRERIQAAQRWMSGWEDFVYERIQSNETLPNPYFGEWNRPVMPQQCQSFGWYIRHWRPDLWTGDESIKFRGWIRSIARYDTLLQLALQEDGSVYLDEWYKAQSTIWYFTGKGYLKTQGNACLGTIGDSRNFGAHPCPNESTEVSEKRDHFLLWNVIEVNGYVHLQLQRSKLCLSWTKAQQPRDDRTMTLEPLDSTQWSTDLQVCKPQHSTQSWMFVKTHPFKGRVDNSAKSESRGAKTLHGKGSNAIRNMKINPG